MRIAFLRVATVGGLAAVVVALAAVFPAAGNSLQQSVASVVNPPPVGTAHYTVQGDPRLCPSPLCGGYWVALANHARTRCHDGALRPRCYVAKAVDEDRHALTSGVPEGALVRALIEPWTFPGFGELGALVVADIRTPLGRKLGGVFYRVRDLGVRCVRAPCFSMRASRLNKPFRITVSDLDLRLALLTAEERSRAEGALASPNGLFAAGRIEQTSEGGRVFRAWRIYLRAPTPRG